MAKRKAPAEQEEKPPGRQVVIKPPNFGRAVFHITGTSPYVQLKFSKKAQEEMEKRQEAGKSSGNTKTSKPPKDFQALYQQGMHQSSKGWRGIPAAAFRSAMISACNIAGFAMTKAKLTIFIEPDGADKNDETPLVRITRGQPKKHIGPVRNADGSCDMRARAMWREWEADVCVRYDQDQFKIEDVTNLLMRVGAQVGIGEGRADSKSRGGGMGWGFFTIQSKEPSRGRPARR